MNRYAPVFLIMFLLMVAAGCSSNGSNPVTPTGNESEFTVPLADISGSDTNRSMLGAWIAVFNPDSMNPDSWAVEISPDRANAAHMDVTSFIPTPGIVVNSFNPTSKILDVDVTIHNTYPIYGFDVRLIIFTDSAWHRLVNADSWTGLYDKPGGLPINPFKAYAKFEPGREFLGTTQHTENLQIYCPGDNFAISFAVDASYPNNCEEPYEISGFYQETLLETAGSSTDVEISVLDWQSDANAVYLYCPAITGIDLAPFAQTSPDLWGMTLVNNTGAMAGDYVGYILATSSGSGTLALYNEVVITVTKAAAIDPVGNVIITVNRVGLEHGINAAVPWTLNWNAVPDAEEYAIYYDTEPSNPYYFQLVATVPSAQTTFYVPASHYPPNHLVKGYTYIVRARATAGDPSSESVDSEYAYVSVSSFDTFANRYTLHNNQANREGWTTAVERFPYAEGTDMSYWPYGTTLHMVSEPYCLCIMPINLGVDWTVGTGEPSDNYPGKLIAITKETPPIPDSTVRRIDFCASCSGSWSDSDLGGVVIGTSESPTQPMDGWDGTDFVWAKADDVVQGYQPYNWRHSSITYAFPFNMDAYIPPQLNCWRWESG